MLILIVLLTVGLVSGNVNDDCRKHVQAFQERADNLFLTSGVEDFWALRLHDSSGAIPDGCLLGNLNSLGSYSGCVGLDVENPILIETGEKLPGFRGRFIQGILYNSETEDDAEEVRLVKTLTRLNGDDRNAIISISPSVNGDVRDGIKAVFKHSVCMPSSCSEEEAVEVINERLSNFANENTSLSYSSLNSDSKVDHQNIQALDIVCIVIFSLFGVAAIVGTIYDFLIRKKFMTTQHASKTRDFILGFSTMKNAERLFDASPPKSADVITCLNGIRFMSMGWVLFSHTYGLFQGFLPVVNYLSVIKFVDNFWIQVLLNGYFSVDSFFFLSGLLLSFLTMKELDRARGKILFFIAYYIHRYIRLTAIYALVILFRSSLLHFFAHGPNNIIEDRVNDCRKSYWRNLLYINNFFSKDTEEIHLCVGPAWYLACEWQMFLITPLILFPMWRWKKLLFDYWWPCLWCLASTLYLLIMYIIKEWPLSMQLDFDLESDYWLLNYSKPWGRFQPYGVGIIIGYILYVQRGKRIKLSWVSVAGGWLLALGTSIGLIYGVNFPKIFDEMKDFHSQAEHTIYGVVTRLVWGIVLAWVVWACVKGYGGVVNKMLSWEAFFPLSRLCYCMYLTHDMMIDFLGLSWPFHVSFSHIAAVFAICWVLMLTILVAIPMVVFFEMPLLHMEKFLMGMIFGGTKRSEKR